MAWSVELSTLAQKNLEQLDAPIRRRILSFLHERITNLEDARSIGEALKGARLGQLWKYRVGDYRLIASIEDEAVKILVVKIGNRKEVYK
jgi:mRNA interferase RelE/StbE